jgi:putative ABC transport system substrate-binding protein
MNRRSFIGVLAGSLLAAPLVAEGQLTGKVWRVGFLEAGSSSVNRPFLDAFRQGLRELGYEEGQQIAIEDRWAEGQSARFPRLLEELLRDARYAR